MNQRQEIFAYALTQYGVSAEYLWANLPDYAVLRHPSSGGQKGKWFALIGHIEYHKLGVARLGSSDFLNIKCRPDMVMILQQQQGILPAYHMNKQHWLTILLDGSVPFDELVLLIDGSYDLTKPKKLLRKQKSK